MKSDQPNQRSEHCRERKERKRNRKNHSRDGSTDEALLRFTGLAGLNGLELGLHLGDLIVHHPLCGPQFVVLSGIGSELTGLGQLRTKGGDLRCIGSEGSSILQRFAALVQIALTGHVTRTPIQGDGTAITMPRANSAERTAISRRKGVRC